MAGKLRVAVEDYQKEMLLMAWKISKTIF